MNGLARSIANDMRVRTPRDLFTYPDVVAICGPATFKDNEIDTLVNPTLIVEVLSSSTEAYDRITKLSHYRTIPSLREVILVSQDRVHIEHFLWQMDSEWIRETVTSTEGLPFPRSAASSRSEGSTEGLRLEGAAPAATLPRRAPDSHPPPRLPAPHSPRLPSAGRDRLGGALGPARPVEGEARGGVHAARDRTGFHPADLLPRRRGSAGHEQVPAQQLVAFPKRTAGQVQALEQRASTRCALDDPAGAGRLLLLRPPGHHERLPLHLPGRRPRGAGHDQGVLPGERGAGRTLRARRGGSRPYPLCGQARSTCSSDRGLGRHSPDQPVPSVLWGSPAVYSRKPLPAEQTREGLPTASPTSS